MEEETEYNSLGDAAIPDNVLIPCPAKGFANCRAKHCLECVCCKQVVLVNPAANLSWSQQHQIDCGYVIRRSCTEFVD